MRRSFLAIMAALGAAIIAAGVVTAGHASAAMTSSPPSRPGTTSTLVNFNSAGQQTVRFDTSGNAIDAHDGQLARFGNEYYLYGTSYNCGYRWQINSSFCGFKVYSSTDLVHWTDRGFVVAAYQCADCFRPHVIYDPATKKYVLWTNDSSTAAPGDFRVYTSDSPTGPFTQQALPTLAYDNCGWDFGLFQDPVTGRGYMVDTDCPDSDRGLVVEQLSPDDLTSDGQYDVIHMTDQVESPAMFYRNGTYYITMSDPTCGYCTATGTGYLTASNPLGTWSGASVTSPWTIENGALHVTGGAIGVSAAGADWTDYTFAADATPLQTATQDGVSYAQVGMAVRMDAAGNGYAFLLSNYPYTSPAQPGYITFVSFADGNATSVQPFPLPFAVTGGSTYHVAITVSGETISAAVNGVIAGTVTDSTYAAGAVGFREYGSNDEQAIFANVSVTAPDGTILMSDNFSDGLSQWDAPPPVVASHLISANSCGGQPSFVAPPVPGAGGRPIYLYGSDLWDGSPNEALANYFWAPLKFGSGGAIEPIEHRLFCHITRTWRARPLMTADDAVAGIAATITAQGLKCHPVRDGRDYPEGVKVSDQQMRYLEKHAIVRHGPHRDRNYTIRPAPRSGPDPEPAGPDPALIAALAALAGIPALETLRDQAALEWNADRTRRLALDLGHERRRAPRSKTYRKLSGDAILAAAACHLRLRMPWALLGRLFGVHPSSISVPAGTAIPALAGLGIAPQPGTTRGQEENGHTEEDRDTPETTRLKNDAAYPYRLTSDCSRCVIGGASGEAGLPAPVAESTGSGFSRRW
ncbi:MAG: family 43 glycosylhydrolase [Streptosporangiaceae bacterium]|jgi:hypothetical protein